MEKQSGTARDGGLKYGGSKPSGATYTKTVRVKDPVNIARVKNLPCLICRRWPSDSHHVTTRGSGASFEPDRMDNLQNLCREHHAEVHQIGYGKMCDKYHQVYDWLVEHDRYDIIYRFKKIDYPGKQQK